jgi:hypothetical protein
MSWSVSAIGKPAVVAASIEKQFGSYGTCPEPEETAKQLVRQAIAALANGQTKPDTVVKVSANGSQSYSNDGPGTPPTEVSNSLSLSFETLYGFVE